MPSSTIDAKARILRFKIDYENCSKISQKQRCQQGMSQCKAYVCLLYMWPTVWGVPKPILQSFLTFLGILNRMPSGAKFNYLCKGSNFTIKNWLQKSLNQNTNEGTNKESDTIYGTYKIIYACFIYFKLFSSMLNIIQSGAKFNYSCKSSNFVILGHVLSNVERCQAEKSF